MSGTDTSQTATPWHVVFLWFLGALALIALADPLPQIATWVAVLIIAYLLLSNWSIYGGYVGLK